MERAAYWKCCVIGYTDDANADTATMRTRNVTGWTLESMIVNACMEALVLFAIDCDTCTIEDITCICNACNGGGKATKTVKRHAETVKCPRCKGVGSFERRENVTVALPAGIRVKKSEKRALT